MTIETKDMDVSEVDNAAETATVTKETTGNTLEEQLASLKLLSQDAIKTRDAAKRKLREIELANEKAISEANRYKEKLISKTVNDSLKNALVDAGVQDNALGTAIKLIDKSAIALTDEFEADLDSVKAVVEALKASDSFLFKQVEAPKTKEEKEEPKEANSVKRASDKASMQDAYSLAVKGAKTQKELDEVMRKFGVIK